MKELYLRKKMLLIPLATRGRPQLLLRTLTSTAANIKDNTCIVVLIDEDDVETTNIVGKIWDIPHCFPYVNPRAASLGAKYNSILKWEEYFFLKTADCYLAMVDYTPILTPGFDSILLSNCNHFPDGISFLLSNKANLSFSGLNAWTPSVVEHLGYLYPPYFPYWFLDHWIEDVAWMTNRVVWVDISIDRSARPGTQNKRDFPFWVDFWNASYRLRELDAQKLINHFDPNYSTWNRQSWPLIHQRSSILYSMMLQDYAQSNEPEAPDSPLHASLRAQANQLLRSL